ncbi:MAG: hypothetical protein JSV65_13680 [Armatimonadota bacterium]|nr:MAG: hypothetical protein JSV65_13680 [Armatimonadota bacterium]
MEQTVAQALVEALSPLSNGSTLLGVMLAMGALPLLAAIVIAVWRSLSGHDSSPSHRLVQD